MGCKDKHTNICVDNIPSTCIDYEGKLGINTKITESCVNQFDVNEDLYTIIDEIKSDTSFSEILDSCILISSDSKIKDVVTMLVNKICSQELEIQNLQNTNYADIDITGFGLTIPDCIADSCENPPTTLSDWMQVMMDKTSCL